MNAFESGYEMGANWVESDVKVTADGAFVLIHDQTVDRTTDGAGTVSESSMSYIAGLDAGSWFDQKYKDARIPVLVELLDWAETHSGMCLPSAQELSLEDANTVCQLVADHYLLDKTLIMSLDFALVRELKKMFPRICTGLLYQQQLSENFRRALRGDLDYLHPAQFTVNKRIVRQAHEAGVPVAAVVLPQKDWILERWRWGVDIFNCDDPGMPRHVIEAELRTLK